MKQQTSATSETGIKIRMIISFRGKTFFVGIDVHKKDWQVAAYHEGIVLGNHRMNAELLNLNKDLLTQRSNSSPDKVDSDSFFVDKDFSQESCARCIKASCLIG